MLQLQNFTTLLNNMAAAVQGACSTLIDMTVGSVVRALLQAFASVALWLQWLIVLVLQMTRAATSVGTDLDSWMADFGITRLAGSYATGTVTFSRFTDTSAVTVAIGTTVVTSDLTQTFAVTADSTNAYWNGTDYTIPAGTASAGLPVQAQTIGTAGNVQAGAITLLGAATPGIDTVSNASAFTNGVAAETDAALRARFVVYINSLSRATLQAIDYAVADTAGVISYTVTTNYDPNGAYDPGSFYVVADDGTGVPNSTVINAVLAQLALYAGNGIRFSCIGPSKVTATISMTITTAAGYTHSTLTAAVQTAVTAYINALPVGAGLNYLRIAQLAFDASPGITGVDALVLNGGTADLTATSQQVIRAGTVTVS